MNQIWQLLGIEPTDDRREIRKAFAAQSRLHHPEEEPEYFARLNMAYRQALGGLGEAGGEKGPERGSGDSRERFTPDNGERAEPAEKKGREKSTSDDEGKAETVGKKGRDPFTSGDEEEAEPKEKKGSAGNREEKETVRPKDNTESEDRKSETSESARAEDSAESGDREKDRGSGDAGPEEEKTAASLLDRLDSAQEQTIRESRQTGALRDFISLFENPKQAKQADTWRRFFLSESFLGEQFQESFAKGMVSYLREQTVFPWDDLLPAFLLELAIAYALVPHFAGEEYTEGLKYPKEWYKVSVEDTFPARKHMAEIFNFQGRNCDLKSVTRKMLKQPANKVRYNAFSDYITLKEMNRRGQLTERDRETWQRILRFCQVHYLYERNGRQLRGADCESRSECVAKLYAQWLKDEALPEHVLKFIYKEFAFRELERSSTKGLYGPLKEQVVRQLPHVEQLLFGEDGKDQKITRLYKACARVINDNQNNYDRFIYGETPQIREQVKAFFAMEEWEQVRNEREFFDRLCSAAKRLVMPRSLAQGLVEYLEEGEFPEPERTELAQYLLRSMATERMCRELDYRFEETWTNTDPDRLGENEDFWQYYLMRGFGNRHRRIRGKWEEGYLYEMNGECYLPAFIRFIYAPSKMWQKRFVRFDEETETIREPVSAGCLLPDGRRMRVEFHYRYCLYFVDEKAVTGPVMDFQELERYQERLEKAEEFFFLLGITAIGEAHRQEAERVIEAWLEKIPIHAMIRPLVARLLAADNAWLPEDTEAVIYSEDERFCCRAVVSGTGIRLFRQMDYGWEDRIFREQELDWKEIAVPEEVLAGEMGHCGLGVGESRATGNGVLGSESKEAPGSQNGLLSSEREKTGAGEMRVCGSEPGEPYSGQNRLLGSEPEARKGLAERMLACLRQPKPVSRGRQDLTGMTPLEKAAAILKAMRYFQLGEGYCVLRYGEKREKRHDRLFYGAAYPFGFRLNTHTPAHQRTVNYLMAASETKIKERRRYVGRFGWGFKYSPQSDYGPMCVYLGESGTYYAYESIRMHRADNLDSLLADYFGRELEGVTEVEAYEGCLTVSRLDHRLEYCYGEEELLRSVHTTKYTRADTFTVFGGFGLYMEFARWMDGILRQGLPEWVNDITVWSEPDREGALSLTGIHAEEEPGLFGTLWGEEPETEEEDQKEGEESPGPEEKKDYGIYRPEAPLLVWGKGIYAGSREQSLVEAVQWYVDTAVTAEVLKGISIHVAMGTPPAPVIWEPADQEVCQDVP